MQYGIVGGVHIELAVPKGEPGMRFSEDFFRQLELRVNTGGERTEAESSHWKVSGNILAEVAPSRCIGCGRSKGRK